MRDTSLEQRGIDFLSLAGLETMGVGSKRAHSGQDTSGNVRHRRTDFAQWAPRTFTCNTHQAAHTLGDQVKATPIGIGAGAPGGGRAKKVIGTVLDRKTGDYRAKINVSAKVIVLAAGTINTPQILLGSEVPTESGLVGKNLLLQPYTMVVGLFPEELKSYKGIPQAYYADQFEEIDEERGLSGFRLEGGFTLPGQVSTIVPVPI